MSTEENLIKRQKQKMRNQPAIPSLAAKKTAISETVLDQLFRQARTHSAWQQSLYALKFSARHTSWHVLAPQVPMARPRDLSF